MTKLYFSSICTAICCGIEYFVLCYNFALCEQEDRVILDLDERSMHGKPWNTYHVLKAIPDVVVYPK